MCGALCIPPSTRKESFLTGIKIPYCGPISVSEHACACAHCECACMCKYVCARVFTSFHKQRVKGIVSNGNENSLLCGPMQQVAGGRKLNAGHCITPNKIEKLAMIRFAHTRAHAYTTHTDTHFKRSQRSYTRTHTNTHTHPH